MQTFLQRVFAQSVQAFVEVIMEKASSVAAPSFVGPGGTINQATGALEPLASTSPAAGSHLAFLRALHVSRSGSLALVNDLKMYDFRGAGIVAPNSAPASAGGVTDNGSLMLLGSDAAGSSIAHAGGSPLAAMLDQAVEELFVPYMESIRYVERESRNLTDLYAGFLSKYIAYHVSVPISSMTRFESTGYSNTLSIYTSPSRKHQRQSSLQTLSSIA